MKDRISCITALMMLLTVILGSSCVRIDPDFGQIPYHHQNGNGDDARREPAEPVRNVMLMYSAEYNNLADALEEDIEDICSGFLPYNFSKENVLLIFKKTGYYTTEIPVLMRASRASGGKLALDTLKTWPSDTPAASAVTMNEVLSYVKDNFPAKGYGMLFSSHATGWLPAGYYANSGAYTLSAGAQKARTATNGYVSVPYYETDRDPSLPMVKSIGADYVSRSEILEMELKDFAEAIPMHLDYIFFDCCLMGGVEVAYELKDKCDHIIFSPTEVLAEGFDYTSMGERLLGGDTPDLEGVCRDYYEYYSNHPKGGQYMSATVTLVDCSGLEALASVCKDIFSAHRDGLESVVPEQVQGYFTGNKHWFYDLGDIIRKAGAGDEEISDLEAALDGCIAYKAHTERFLTFLITAYSGMSMYLPCNGSDYLDAAYTGLQWNIATGLVSETAVP